ncbi:uncharacterized protein [Haliotis asinina]|uniref:uncharacterized protein n=1 Tax=Haliotis asinina TaxID=109174 RepID=UPI003531EFC7
MAFSGRRHDLGLCVLLLWILTPFFQGAVEIVCPNAAYLDSTVNLTCIGTGRTHSFIQPKGGVVTTCNMNSSQCLPAAMVTIHNSSYSVLTVPMVNLSQAGWWECSVGDIVSRCLLTVAKIPSCTLLNYRSTPETTVRVQYYYCSESIELHLKFGSLTRLLLNTTRTNTTVDIWETTVNVPTSFEEKMLIYVCGNTTLETACRVMEETAPSNRTGIAVIISSVVGGIVIVTVIITLLILLMKSKRVERPEANTVTYAPESIYDVAGQTNDTARDVNKPSACYDNILNARYGRFPDESSVYDIASS